MCTIEIINEKLNLTDITRLELENKVKYIYIDKDKNSTVFKMKITAEDGKNYNIEVYTLDAIIAVGYRINSKKISFRIQATKILYRNGKVDNKECQKN